MVGAIQEWLPFNGFGVGTLAHWCQLNTNFLFRRYTSTPPTPLVKGGVRKVSVTGI